MIIWRNVETTAVAMKQATIEPTKTPTGSSVLVHSSTKHNMHNIIHPWEFEDIPFGGKTLFCFFNELYLYSIKKTINGVGGQCSEAQW